MDSSEIESNLPISENELFDLIEKAIPNDEEIDAIFESLEETLAEDEGEVINEEDLDWEPLESMFASEKQ